MNILVIGGMHGNEPLGPEVIERFRKRPIDGISTLIANKPAVRQKVRFTKKDLNRCFPGNPMGSYESIRADEILKLCKGFDIVIDFHNTHCPDNNCGFVGETAKTKLFDIAVWLGLNRVIIADYDCINKYAPNCLSVEISLDSRENNATIWYERIKDLTTLPEQPRQLQPELFRFVYRMTLEDKARLSLDQQYLQAFKVMPKKLAASMGVKSPAFPIFIGDAYTPYNYGGLLNKLSYNGDKT